MSALLLDGKSLSARLREQTAADVRRLVAQTGLVPSLAAVLVGHDPASQVYIRNKHAACEQAGLRTTVHRLESDTSNDALLGLVAQLNNDPSVHGILVQLPLPGHLDTQRVLDAVAPEKDVDCFHPENVGRLVQGRTRFAPCTPQGVMELLAHYEIPLRGRHAVVLGRSEIVGKPMASLLLQRGADATVTVCHSQTRDLPSITRQADVLIAAIGRPRFVTAEMVRPGAVVVDVGINRTEAGLCGDVDFDAVAPLASHITPVPGGVGPLTIAMLLRNTLTAAGCVAS